jgi:predicted nucleotidyltransferase
MRPSLALAQHRDEIRRLVMAHRGRNPRVFGSVVRDEDRDESDLDLLIDPTPETTLMDLGALRLDLRTLLGVPVDVLTPNALSPSVRAAVLAVARPL